MVLPRSADPGGTAAYGGGPRGVRGGDGAAQPRHRPAQQGAHREVRDERPRAEAAQRQPAARPGLIELHTMYFMYE